MRPLHVCGWQEVPPLSCDVLRYCVDIEPQIDIFGNAPILEADGFQYLLPSKDCMCLRAIDVQRSDRDACSVGSRLGR